MSFWAKLYVGAVSAAGITLAAWAAGQWRTDDWARFFAYLIISVLASGLRIRIPQVNGSLSAQYLFIFVAVTQLSLAETVALGVVSSLTQRFWAAQTQVLWYQVLFNASNISISTYACYEVYRGLLALSMWVAVPIALAVAVSTYFFINTVLVSVVFHLVQSKPLWATWRQSYGWSYPYYIAGGALAGLFTAASEKVGWSLSIFVLPIVYLIYRSYTTYLGRLEDGRKHAEEVASLHLRTIETLALAIEAKDDTTHAHLKRVQTYAVELGRDLGLDDRELEALRAAAILHDIGKLAVPEHIICKPGKLTPEEFEKMKVHPVVGAEILEHVKFPYPVAPIVCAHHEKWNGAGYPYGLKGEEIPVGARILAAVDCLDALASDRQYRKALPIDEAMKVVLSESGKSFDPRVIEALDRRFKELEALAQANTKDLVKLSTHLRIERGAAPAAGFEASNKFVARGRAEGPDFITAIAAARHEILTLFELHQDLGLSLSLSETMSLVAVRLRQIIPFDALALYVQRDDRLEAQFAQGENARLFQSLRIPLGEGLTGWVAKHGKAILNGNPAVEPGYLNDPSKFTTLRSALAVPLAGVDQPVGVLALYRADRDSFQRDHQRVLQSIAAKLGIAVSHALEHAESKRQLGADTVTGLPNLRTMFVRLDAELARAKRNEAPLTVLSCQLTNFREFSSERGQAKAQELLRAFAQGLREVFREYDLVARLGQEEFVVIIPEIPPAAIARKQEQISQMAAQLPLGRLEVATGAASYPEQGQTVEDLLAEADRQVFLARRAARAARPATRVAPDVVPAVVAK
jgi:diguanylate cyclase (GGDEF)-like protein/putative nucleotidyltransferase with HDIG domain